MERRANGQFFVVQINRRDGNAVTAPAPATKLYGGDGMVIIGRSGSAARALFDAEAQAEG